MSRLRTWIIFIVVAFAASVSVRSSSAQSMWDRRDPSKVFLFQDLKARNVGDLLTVVISENTALNHNDKRALGKKNLAKSLFKFNYALGGGFGTADADADGGYNASAERSMNGDTSFKENRIFSDRFTVQVVDVLPNGNMVISGKRKLAVEGDSRTMVLTGIVRGYDIFADNSVNSRLVADLQINYEGEGAEQAFINQGWLGKRINKIWPH